jgi:hypothetical protein
MKMNINRLQLQNLGINMNQDILNLTPEAVKLIAKLIKYSNGGFSSDEKQELIQDLLALALKILEHKVDNK